jgi:hypothetical protein
MTSKGRGGIYEGRESYSVALIVAEVKILGCPGYTIKWEGLPDEANITEYVVNVKRQGKWEFVLQQLKDAKVEADKVRSLLFFIFDCNVHTQVDHALPNSLVP